MSKGDGGPAFPDNRGHMGMSLRDWFAGQALAGNCSLIDERTPRTPEEKADVEKWRDRLREKDARFCYAMADAMLKAREGTKNG